MTEKQIVEEFKKMCESSLEPDKYSFLMDEILPALVDTRKSLKESNIDWDMVEDIDGKLVLQGNGPADGTRYLTDEEAADYIWGTSLLKPPISVEVATSESNPAPVCGMYGDTPKVVIGKYSICEMSAPPDGYVWIDGDVDGASFDKSVFEKAVEKFYNENF